MTNTGEVQPIAEQPAPHVALWMENAAQHKPPGCHAEQVWRATSGSNAASFLPAREVRRLRAQPSAYAALHYPSIQQPHPTAYHA